MCEGVKQYLFLLVINFPEGKNFMEIYAHLGSESGRVMRGERNKNFEQ